MLLNAFSAAASSRESEAPNQLFATLYWFQSQKFPDERAYTRTDVSEVPLSKYFSLTVRVCSQEEDRHPQSAILAISVAVAHGLRPRP